MSWGGPGFVIAIIAICILGSVLNNWIRARHGYAPTDDWGKVDGSGQVDDQRKVQLLTADNEKLSGQVGRLEDRIAVLERIVTDPAHRTARDIDALR